MVWTNGEMGATMEMAGRSSDPGSGGLTDLDRAILGRKECRLCVPVVSRHDLRMVADIMRGLATILDIESRRNDVPDRASLFRVQSEVARANRQIQDHFKAVHETLGILPPSRGGRPRND
jgi:hypothetical protein